MILSHPRAPLIFGTAMIGLLAVYLVWYHPTPGPLAAPHAAAVGGAGLATCRICHANEGLAAGCLRCHTEIAAQVRTDSGYHAFLLRGKEVACARCHPDHLGSEFPLLGAWERGGPNGFDHPHVPFTLAGAHKDLACATCHQYGGPFSLPDFPDQPRRWTYLGLTQACADCHQDVHTGTLARSCESCHSQEAFRPAVRFRHDDHYQLEGAHAEAACLDCHLPKGGAGCSESPVADVNTLRLAFEKVKGTTCADCHETPHRTRWPGDCTPCHLASDRTWAQGTRGIRTDTHALTGFPLREAHGTVACAKCHAAGLSYDRRYPDPRAADYRRDPKTCEGCHEDPHGGQFLARHSHCSDCHEQERFLPARYGIAQHAASYPLTGMHAGVPCIRCHVSPEKMCEKPTLCGMGVPPMQHRRDADATEPHGQDARAISHTLSKGTSVRRFASTSRDCRGCHADPHGGQFERETAQGDCTACHRQEARTFAIRPYDHAGRTGYPLTGAHEETECGDCHRERRGELLDGARPGVRVYRGTPTACDACHSDTHRGQFKENEKQDCQRCHNTTDEWTANGFNHNRGARFALDGIHANLACGACHPVVRQSDGQNVVQYRPLGTRCEDCHGFTPQ